MHAGNRRREREKKAISPDPVREKTSHLFENKAAVISHTAPPREICSVRFAEKRVLGESIGKASVKFAWYQLNGVKNIPRAPIRILDAYVLLPSLLVESRRSTLQYSIDLLKILWLVSMTLSFLV